MARGRKTGGRVAGTPNRRTEELVTRLEALGVDPVSGLAMIANDPTASLDLRARVQMELLGYMYPKRRSIDVSAPDPAGRLDPDRHSGQERGRQHDRRLYA